MEKKKAIVVLGIILSIVAITGCIEMPPETETMILREDITPAQIAAILGVSETEVATAMTDLNVKIYSTDEDFSVMCDSLKEPYIDWAKHMNGLLVDTPELKIYIGVWRRVININAIIVAEGTYIREQTAYDTLVLTSYGELTQYTEMLNSMEL